MQGQREFQRELKRMQRPRGREEADTFEEERRPAWPVNNQEPPGRLTGGAGSESQRASTLAGRPH